MSRRPRIELAGAMFFVEARGNGLEPVFGSFEDSLKFLSILEDICTDQEWDCFAWCLVPDGYRLLLRTRSANLGKGMQRLNGRYAGWVNERRGNVGHLLARRYSAVIVDPDVWGLALIRFMALGPVRAGLTEKAEHWRWSSYRYLVDTAAREVPGFLSAGEVLRSLDPDAVRSRLALQRFVERGLAEDAANVAALEDLVGWHQVLGSRRFARDVEAKIGTGEKLTSTEPKPIAKFQQDFDPADRAMAAAYWIGGYRQKDIATAFKTHISTVSRAGSRYAEEFAS